MSRKQRARRWLLAVAIATALAFTVQSSSQADEWYPGLPDNVGRDYFPAPYGSTGTWGGAAQGGMSYATRAKQWFRTSDGMVTYVAGGFSTGEDPVTHINTYGVRGAAFFVSPKGAPANYGYLAPMTVRSVGFGLMPVEATVQISQRRENGYPIALTTNIGGRTFYDPSFPGGASKQEGDPTPVSDAVNVQILKVKVDGVDLGLTGDCRTKTPAPLNVSTPAFTIPVAFQPPHDPTIDVSYIAEWFRTHDPSTYFNPFYGGQLKGTITIPPFTGCTTKSGDDLSALMTLSVSGPDNPVTAVVAWPCATGGGAPLPPGADTPKGVPDGWRSKVGDNGCHGAKKLPYPDRPDH
jgi:hypothetical protein